MPNPDKLAPKVDTKVIIVTGQASAAGFSSPLFNSEFLASPSFPTRIKGYTGSAREKDALLAADGFPADGAARRQVAAAMAQDGPPATIYVGRRDAGDAGWGDTLDAITAENDEDWYAIAIDDRSSAGIQQVDQWVSPAGGDDRFAIFISYTDSTQVRDGTPGNFGDVITARGRNRTALAYHDSAISSGLAPATISTRTGPFVFGASETLAFRFDGGATQSYTFTSTAGVAPGLNAEPFDFTAGGVLTLAANGLPSADVDFTSTGATLTSGNAEPFLGLSPGAQLLVRVDGGPVEAATLDAAPAVLTSPNTEPFAPVNLEFLDLKINGGVTQTFVFDGSETTAALTADMINLTASGFTATAVGGAVTFTTDRAGTTAEIEIEATTSANILAEYGWVAGSTFGTGDVADIDSVTAAEIVAVILTDISDVSASDVGGSVVITADSLGFGSALQVTGGSINDATVFPTTQVMGTGPFVDASAASAAEVAAAINADISGLVASVNAGAVLLTSTQLGSGSSVTVTAGAVATELGLFAATYSGTGPFANAAQATAAELQIEINTQGIVGGTAQEVSSALQLASATSGPSSSAEITTDTVGLSWTGDGFAFGVGTDEDYFDCAWIGRCITFNLDATDGVSIWDNQELAGIAPDPLTKAQRTNLDQRRINSYVSLRRGRSQTQWGYMAYKPEPTSSPIYISEVTTADWVDLRTTEAIDDTLNNYAKAKRAINYGDGAGGFGVIENACRGVWKAADRNGHLTYDGGPLDLLDDDATGVFFPTFADQSQANIDAGEYAGIRARFNYKSKVRRVSSLIELQRPPVQL